MLMRAVGEAGWAATDPLGATSALAADSARLGHQAKRVGAGAGASASSGLAVVAGDQPTRCWNAVHPEVPNSTNTTSATSCGRLMAFPPASTSLSPVRLRKSAKSDSLRIGLCATIHRHGAQPHPGKSTRGSGTVATQFLLSTPTF
jgi:hypothetical protein